VPFQGGRRRKKKRDGKKGRKEKEREGKRKEKKNAEANKPVERKARKNPRQFTIELAPAFSCPCPAAFFLSSPLAAPVLFPGGEISDKEGKGEARARNDDASYPSRFSSAVFQFVRGQARLPRTLRGGTFLSVNPRDFPSEREQKAAAKSGSGIKASGSDETRTDPVSSVFLAICSVHIKSTGPRSLSSALVASPIIIIFTNLAYKTFVTCRDLSFEICWRIQLRRMARSDRSRKPHGSGRGRAQRSCVTKLKNDEATTDF